jgi:hypothetical protein
VAAQRTANEDRKNARAKRLRTDKRAQETLFDEKDAVGQGDITRTWKSRDKEQ